MSFPKADSKSVIALSIPAILSPCARLRYLHTLTKCLVMEGYQIKLVISGDAIEPIRTIKECFDEFIPDHDTFFVPWIQDSDVNTRISAELRDAFIASLEPDLVLKASFGDGNVDLAAIQIDACRSDAPKKSITLFPPPASDIAWQKHAGVASDITLPVLTDEIFSPEKINTRELNFRRQLLGFDSPYITCLIAPANKGTPLMVRSFLGRLPTKPHKCHPFLFVNCNKSLRSDIRAAFAESGHPEHMLRFLKANEAKSWREIYLLSEAVMLVDTSHETSLMAEEARQCGARIITPNDIDCIFSAQKNTENRDILSPKDPQSADAVLLIEMLKEKIEALQAIERNPACDQFSNYLEKTWPDKVPGEWKAYVAEISRRLHHQPRNKMLFVDVSELHKHDARTGIQRVTRSILSQLLLSPPENHSIVPVYATADCPDYKHVSRDFRKAWGLHSEDCDDMPVFPLQGDTFLGLDLQQNIVIARRHDLKKMRMMGVTVAFVVYDLLPIEFPESFPPETSANHRAWLSVISGMDKAICISRSVAAELNEWVRENSGYKHTDIDITWFHLGADIEHSRPTRGLPPDSVNILNRMAGAPSFLLVGTLEPRKGLVQVLDAFEDLWREGLKVNLVLVGKAGWQIDTLTERLNRHSQSGERLFWLSGISDEYLEKIYRSCTCMIAASRGEGFGLPLIEAARNGLPIIARDLKVFREVAGSNARYFSGEGTQDLSDCIRRWYEDYQSGAIESSDNIRWLTWQQSAEQLKQALAHRAQPVETQEHRTSWERQPMSDDASLHLLEQISRQLNEANQRIEAMEERFSEEAQLRESEWGHRYNQLRHKFKVNEAELGKKSQECTGLTTEIKHLQDRLQKSVEAEHQLSLILSSRSWRITSPLRKLSQIQNTRLKIAGKPKEIMLANILRAFDRMIAGQTLPRKISSALSKYPWLHRRVAILARKLMSVSASRKRLQSGIRTYGKISDKTLDELGLSPEVQEIFFDLKKAVRQEPR